MQTFLPYYYFDDSARCLDNVRLWKQCLEAKQLLNGHFKNHPASKMWVGYEEALKCYLYHCIDEWEKRGKNNNSIDKESLEIYKDQSALKMPPWLDKKITTVHRGRLLFKGEADRWYDIITELYKTWKLKRKNLINYLCKEVYHIPEFNNWKIKNLEFLKNNYSNLESSILSNFKNHYSQFGWEEKMVDENYWPV